MDPDSVFTDAFNVIRNILGLASKPKVSKYPPKPPPLERIANPMETLGMIGRYEARQRMNEPGAMAIDFIPTSPRTFNAADQEKARKAGVPYRYDEPTKGVPASSIPDAVWNGPRKTNR